VLFPRAAPLARILRPPQALRKPGAAYDVDMAIAIYVERQVTEVVDVVAGVVDGAELVLGPAGRLVPVLARDDVELPVPVDVGDRAGLTRTEIGFVLANWDFIGPSDRPGDRCGQSEREQNKIALHADDCISFAKKEAFGVPDGRELEPIARLAQKRWFS